MDLHPDRNLIRDPQRFDALFESKALRTSQDFREAYREARLFGKAIAKRGGDYLKNLVEQWICSSIHAGLNTAKTLLEGRTVHEEEGDEEINLSIQTDEESEVSLV